MHVAHPFRIDGRGRTASADHDEHVRDLIEQILFTSPGERVNRPNFGSGLLQTVFAPAGDEIAAALQQQIQAILQHWLGDAARIETVLLETSESTIVVTVRYVVKHAHRASVARFEGSVHA